MSTIVLLPFFAAILTFFGIFYAREKATSLCSRNFLLGVLSILGLASYLALQVAEMMSSTVTIAYAVVGVVLFIVALVSTRI